MTVPTLTDTTVGTVTIGGDLPVRRLGFGAMRISGARDAAGTRSREVARALVRRVVERGVNLLDTADIYGYGESEEIIAEALYPYPADLVITTKAGFRPGKILAGHNTLPPLGRPEHIREACEGSLRRLRVDTIDLYQVHTPDPNVPYAETIGAFVELQRAGKVRHIGISNVTTDQLEFAQRECTVVSVQNRYNAGHREAEELLDACTEAGIAFMPHSPISVADSPVATAMRAVATEREIPLEQIALAWLLQRSPIMVPIPGTSSLSHLDPNVDAAWVRLAESELSRITDDGGTQRRSQEHP